MPRYRVAFTREWTLGRWGYLDRFFHDLGGHPSERSGLDNAWIVEYRGVPRQLGRELAKALNIQEADYRKFGPIFDIEELAQQTGASPGSPAPPQDGRDRIVSDRPAADAGKSPSDPAETTPADAEPLGPSWVANSEVEDAALVETVDPEQGFVRGGAHVELDAAGAYARAQARWDDLFRIRTRSNPSKRRRAEAIASASRRRPSTGRPTSE